MIRTRHEDCLPLHGTGEMLARRALASWIWSCSSCRNSLVQVLTSQLLNQAWKPAAFALAEEQRKVDADVLVATDPDADHLGEAHKNS